MKHVIFSLPEVKQNQIPPEKAHIHKKRIHHGTGCAVPKPLPPCRRFINY